MIRDYSGRCAPPQKSGFRQDGKRPAHGSGGKIQKSIGVIMVVLLLMGLFFTMWMGREIDARLHDLNVGREKQESLFQEQEKLTQERDDLMSREKIELAVMKYGLYHPSANQILRPTP